MASKYELTISTNYVPSWTYVEAIRELFQNALDNEIVNKDNKMKFEFNRGSGTASISNKTSVLELDTLLLGVTTKANDTNTIGKHGEGYKIAFMVLLREGKTVTVYNYGNREIWSAKLVKSRRFNNQLVPVITVEKQAIWKAVPNNNLTIEIGNITEEEYEVLVKNNLHLQDKVNSYDVDKLGRILLDESEKGNLYVKGLYICNNKELDYGYDFEPNLVSLDRDRRMIQQFDLAWETSGIWKVVAANNNEIDRITKMITSGSLDVKYFSNRDAIKGYYGSADKAEEIVADKLAEDFIEEHGENSVPITDTAELEMVENNNAKPVIVSETVANYIRKSDKIELKHVIKKLTLKEEFEILLDSIEGKLSEEELDKFEELISRLG